MIGFDCGLGRPGVTLVREWWFWLKIKRRVFGELVAKGKKAEESLADVTPIVPHSHSRVHRDAGCRCGRTGPVAMVPAGTRGTRENFLLEPCLRRQSRAASRH